MLTRNRTRQQGGLDQANTMANNQQNLPANLGDQQAVNNVAVAPVANDQAAANGNAPPKEAEAWSKIVCKIRDTFIAQHRVLAHADLTQREVDGIRAYHKYETALINCASNLSIPANRIPVAAYLMTMDTEMAKHVRDTAEIQHGQSINQLATPDGVKVIRLAAMQLCTTNVRAACESTSGAMQNVYQLGTETARAFIMRVDNERRMLRDIQEWMNIPNPQVIDDAGLITLVIRGLRTEPMATVVRGNQARYEALTLSALTTELQRMESAPHPAVVAQQAANAIHVAAVSTPVTPVLPSPVPTATAAQLDRLTSMMGDISKRMNVMEEGKREKGAGQRRGQGSVFNTEAGEGRRYAPYPNGRSGYITNNNRNGLLCNQCKNPGHKARQCPMTVCFKCGKMGHRVADCAMAPPPVCQLCGQGDHTATDLRCPARVRLGFTPLRPVDTMRVPRRDREQRDRAPGSHRVQALHEKENDLRRQISNMKHNINMKEQKKVNFQK